MKHATLKNFFRVFKCPICREPIKLGEEGEGVLCSICRSKWELEKGKLCPECSLSAEHCRCIPELIRKSGSEVLIKLCFYDSESGSPADRLVLYLKDYRDKRVSDFTARELSELLSRYFGQNGIQAAKTVFTFAPRSRSSLEKTGFDQAKTLAFTCASLLGGQPMVLIKRSTFSRRQKGLDSSSRLKNSKRAFRLKRGIRLDGKTVVLIDDVVTTGASLAACTKLLRDAGAKYIVCASVAKTDTKIK